MINWNTPDERWAALDFPTREAYASTFIIEGKWNANVPEDVKTSYETVEQLMAYAYYHYPMYDDAFKRLLTIMEMAVKYRAQEDGIELTYLDKKTNKQKDKSLSVLIDQVIANTDTEAIGTALHYFRDLRNYLLHPNRNTLMGGMVSHRILTLVNHINLLFLNEERRVANHHELIEQLQPFADGCYVLERNGSRFLVCSFQLRESVQGDESKFLIYCEPVLINTYITVSNHQLPDPYSIVVEELNIEEGRVTATENGNPITCSITSNARDIENRQSYVEDVMRLTAENRNMLIHHGTDYLYKKIEEFRYEYWWG